MRTALVIVVVFVIGWGARMAYRRKAEDRQHAACLAYAATMVQGVDPAAWCEP